MRFLVLICCLAAAALSPAIAAPQSTQVAGVRLADRISVAGRDLVLNGAGLRRYMHMGIYVAALYLPERRHDTHEILNRDIPRSLQLVLLRDVSTQRNLDTLKDGLIANNGPGEMEAIETEVETFLSFIRGLREVPSGTAILLNYIPGTGTLVSANGRYLGTVPGEAFNRAMLRIWLGEDPAQTGLKRALLGAG